MKTEKVHGAFHRKLRAFLPLTNAEIDCIEVMQKKVKTFEAGSALVCDGDPYDRVYIVEDGWAMRFKTLSDGRRQVLNFVLPGDFIGLFSPLFETAEHSVSALTDLTVHPVEPSYIVKLFASNSRLGAALAWSAGRDEALLSEQVVRVGRRSAYERTGHIMLELLHRLRLVGEAGQKSFEMPLTQEILADTLGLSIVHMNRTLRRLRENGLLHIAGDRLIIDDHDRLAGVAEFSPQYLPPEALPQKTAAAISSV